MFGRSTFGTACLAACVLAKCWAESCEESASLLQKFREQDREQDQEQEQEQEQEDEIENDEARCTKVPAHTCLTRLGPYPFKSKAPYDEEGKPDHKDELPVGDCPLCRPSGNGVATLYGVERFDGMGERGAGLLKMLAMAKATGMNFGGFLPSGNLSSHGVDMPHGLTSLIGGDYTKLLLEKKNPQFDHCFYSEEGIILDASKKPPWKKGESVFFATCRTGLWYSDVLLTDEFLGNLRASSPLLKQRVPHFDGAVKKRNMVVAMHVRRGDLVTGSWRAVPDEVNYNIIDSIKESFPDASIHVYSSTEKLHKESEFDGYRDRGAEVHLDGDIADDWAHMAQADVLIMAQSTFGWVPALLNEKCVMAFSSFHHMPGWIIHRNGNLNKGVMKGLTSCLSEKGVLLQLPKKSL